MREEAAEHYISHSLPRDCARSQISWSFPKECPRSAYNTADVSYTYSTVRTVLIQNKLAVVSHRQV